MIASSEDGNTGAEIPDDPIRYGSGVPAELRSSDLAYIEMTGISRRNEIRAAQEEAATQDTLTPSGLVMRGAMHADEQFRQLIADLSTAPDSAQVRARPPGAAQTLVEVEMLLQALDK